jgi:hypothetical protein
MVTKRLPFRDVYPLRYYQGGIPDEVIQIKQMLKMTYQ